MATHTMRRWLEFRRQVHPGKLPTVIVIVDPELQEAIEGPLFVLRIRYRGFSRHIDGLIQRAARAENMGSGFSFVAPGGERDIDFHYATKRSAKAAQARVRALAARPHCGLRIKSLRAHVKPYIY